MSNVPSCLSHSLTKQFSNISANERRQREKFIEVTRSEKDAEKDGKGIVE